MATYTMLESTARNLIPVLEEFIYQMQFSDCEASRHINDMAYLCQSLKRQYPVREFEVHIEKAEINLYKYRVAARDEAEAKRMCLEGQVIEHDSIFGMKELDDMYEPKVIDCRPYEGEPCNDK